MFGLPNLIKNSKRRLSRLNYSIRLFLLGFLLTAFIAFAIYDFLRTAKEKEEEIQTAGLNSELAQLSLALREDDGYPLLENSEQLSKVNRPLSIISFKKSFFSYFLNTSNAKAFNTKDIKWEMPRSCTVEFYPTVEKKGNDQFFLNKLRACLGVIPGDVSGKYIYFAIQYPSDEIHRHTSGKALVNSDYVSLNLKGDQELKVNLVFHSSNYALSRYPSQMARFSGLHEVTAYAADGIKQPLTTVNAQAYEQTFKDDNLGANNYVTILGRVNSNLIFPSLKPDSAWPPSNIKNVRAAIFTNHYDPPSGFNIRRFEIPYGAIGNALVSLEQLYISLISSKAELVIRKKNPSKIVWQSSSLSLTADKPLGLIQTFSDWWVKKILSWTGSDSKEVTITKSINGSDGIEISLKSKQAQVPDIATRSFLWLWLALLLTMFYGFLSFIALKRIKKITEKAYSMTAKPTLAINLDEYAEKQDEIGILGRTFYLLFKRLRSRNAQLLQRMKREAHEHNEAVRVVQEQVKSRRAILDAIGHEIKSPLQSLIIKIPENSEYRDEIERMRRAVDALYEATSVEDGLQRGTIKLKHIDMSLYLTKLTSNLVEQAKEISYQGSHETCLASLDPISFGTVLDHILDNAFRHKTLDTLVEISLESSVDGVNVEIFNYGQGIPEDQLESIFNFGISTHKTPNNLGIGLFSARSHIAAMRGTIHAENRKGGVAFIVTLPSVWKENVTNHA